MMQLRNNPVFKASLLAAILTASPLATAASQDKDKKAAAPVPDPVVIVVMPLPTASDEKLGNGCWARLHERDNFKGDTLTLVGPVDMPTMRTSFGKDWGGEFDSIAVGANATLSVYDRQHYKEKAATVKPGQRVPDLDKKLGFFQDIRSLKIACSK